MPCELFCDPNHSLIQWSYSSDWKLSSSPGIIEWLGLKWTLEIILFQPPHHVQGCHPTRPSCLKPIQPGLQHCQGWGIHSWSGQPVPHHALSKEFLIHNPNLSFFSLKLFPLVLPLSAHHTPAHDNLVPQRPVGRARAREGTFSPSTLLWQGFGLNDLHRSLPTLYIPWFFNFLWF